VPEPEGIVSFPWSNEVANGHVHTVKFQEWQPHLNAFVGLGIAEYQEQKSAA